MGGPFRYRRGRARAGRLHRAGLDPRGPLRVLPTFLRSDPDPGPFDTLGKEWETLRIGFKPYPCCHYNHAYLDCALALRRQHRIEPDSIERIECRVPARRDSDRVRTARGQAAPAHAVRRSVQPGILGGRGPRGRPGRPRHLREGANHRRARAGARVPRRARRRSRLAIPERVPWLGPGSSRATAGSTRRGSLTAEGRGAADRARGDRGEVPRQCRPGAPAGAGGRDRAGCAVAGRASDVSALMVACRV